MGSGNNFIENCFVTVRINGDSISFPFPPKKEDGTAESAGCGTHFCAIDFFNSSDSVEGSQNQTNGCWVKWHVIRESGTDDLSKCNTKGQIIISPEKAPYCPFVL